MSKPKVPPAGEIRQSQMLTSYGPGSMVDLPNHSVIVGGLEFWAGDKERILEERLENWLKKKLSGKLSQPELKLYAPPTKVEDESQRTGVAVYQFPCWFLGQIDATWKDHEGRVYRTRPLIPQGRLVKGGYLTEQRKHASVVPVRFVQACVRGHISDIDWYAFVRRDFSTERTGNLWFDEGGAGSDLAETYVRDEKTGLRRPLSDAAIPDKKMLGTCRGCMPWLGPNYREECDKPNRILTRSASNVYFSQTVSVISIPDRGEDLRKAIARVWEDHLQYSESARDIASERRRGKVSAALAGFTDEEVWAEVDRRRGGLSSETGNIKDVEIETLLAQKDTIGEDKPEGDFFARSYPLGTLPSEAKGRLERLVLVHRLREVIAQVGFTRFEAAMPGVDGELDLEIELAPLARETTWLPAVQNRGEGIFLSFSASAIEAWRKRPDVEARGIQLLHGFDAWKHSKKLDKMEFPGLPYVMLHSLSHLLITALALDCGYSASSLSERIYAGKSGYGILLYTGSSGSEGTLGGLVDMGKNIGRHLKRALELGRLCSNDPVCAQHEPRDTHEERFLHGAACHGCLLIAETSCERRNELLDRALVVPSVGTEGAAFFSEEV